MYTSEEIDRRLELLAQSERRAIIRFLQKTEADDVPIHSIRNHLRESDTRRDRCDDVTIALHHNHLPSLATTDVLDFDSSSETVRYRGDELVETLLDSIPETRTTNG
ncbi:ArsR family transcriptional regulator [Halorubrum sp. CBA1229]|jgi:uncharacterized protein (DUF3084 family)|uniref:DUF7344 domain-containing protein n=1 Tax=Halorubrum sp. CBA1229 TaxID=1853699 RepID=UPI000F3EB604|nr:ArsR family transcriptional regulator [Halorubrum sp. CBA1229]QKY17535.1 ArsR family transcriptional regulator [Halorubrum sp. CBA1229]